MSPIPCTTTLSLANQLRDNLAKTSSQLSLSQLLVGLDNQLDLREDIFACCNARGIQESLQTAYQCSLLARWHKTKRTYSHWQSFRQSTQMLLSNTKLVHKTLEWISDTTRQEKGECFHQTTPADVHLLALLLSWYSNKHCLVIHLDKLTHTTPNIAPDSKDHVQTILITGTHTLWKERSRDIFGSLINLCYNSHTSIWILHHTPYTHTDLSIKPKDMSWKKYLQGLKTQPFYTMICPSTLAKIQELCHLTVP